MSNAKILIVEDEGITAEDIKDCLTSLNYDVLCICSTGEDAIEKVRELAPDLVLMDIMLAGVVDGIQSAEIIREQYGTPVVYLTAYTDPQTLDRAKITDPYGYVLKPFDQRDLQIAVEIALHKHSLQSKIAESQRWLSTTVASVHDALIAVDSSYRIITMNQSAEQLTGWKEADAHGRIFTQVYTSCDAHTGEDLPTPIHLALESGETVTRNGEALLIARGGHVYPVDETASLIVDEIRGVQGAVLVFRDASQRLENENKYRDDLVPAVLDSIAAMLVVTDAEGKIIRLNEKARRVTGLEEEEVKDKYFWDLCSNQEDTDHTSNSFKNINGVKNEMSFDCSWSTKSEGDLKIRWCNSAIREGSDEISYILCTGVGL
ncbi:MAG: PAS domain S-box protein [Verrucomicrobia bacterium]|nr:PAS domain S-box protein [Verrucomicrobiota bacterium]